jgi:4-hydroxybenzoate polyprenyltransferase
MDVASTAIYVVNPVIDIAIAAVGVASAAMDVVSNSIDFHDTKKKKLQSTAATPAMHVASALCN